MSGDGSRLAAFQAWRKRGVGGWRGHISLLRSYFKTKFLLIKYFFPGLTTFFQTDFRVTVIISQNLFTVVDSNFLQFFATK